MSHHKTIKDFEGLRKLCSGHVTIFEGFNFTGKSYLIDKLKLEISRDNSREDAHPVLVVDKELTYHLPPEVRWTYNITLLSLLDHYQKICTQNILISRSILTGQYYNKEREQNISKLITLDVFDYFKNQIVKHNVNIVLIKVNRGNYKRYIKQRNDYLSIDEVVKKYDSFNRYIMKTLKFLDLDDYLYIYNNG